VQAAIVVPSARNSIESAAPCAKLARPDLRGVGFGSLAAIVMNISLIVGPDAATETKAAVIGGLSWCSHLVGWPGR
jgi:hypothetical protein